MMGKGNKEKAEVARFTAKARELGCADDEAAFDVRLRKLAKVKPYTKLKRRRKRP